MYGQIRKPEENWSKAVANSIGQKKSSGKQGFLSFGKSGTVVAVRFESLFKPYKLQRCPRSTDLVGRNQSNRTTQ